MLVGEILPTFVFEGIVKKLGRKYKTHEKFMMELMEIHGNKYDYGKTIYHTDLIPVILTCKIHGEFEINPNHLLRGQGCAECGKIKKGLSRRNSIEDFIKRAKEKHGDKYDYSKVVLKTVHEKVIIICPEHGEFKQTPASHCYGRGCKECYEPLRGASQKYTIDDFIKRAKEKHGDKYDYSLVEYISSQKKIRIICPTHGIFEQRATSHIKYGCQLCANEEITKNLKLGTEKFIIKAKEVHGERYNYSLAEYGNNQKVIIICEKHGKFQQEPTSHLAGRGCPKCISSVGENKIRLYFQKNNIIFEEQKTYPSCKFKKSLRFDFYLPKQNILIEFDGIQHFPEEIKREYKIPFQDFDKLLKCDKIKTEWARNNNIPLLRIKYDADIENILDGLFS